MLKKEVPHRIERTRNKHSRAVLQEDTIIIRLARNLSHTEEQDHIENLLRRMYRKVLVERQKKAIDPFRSLLKGAHKTTVQLVTGQTVSFLLVPGARTRAERIRGGWRVAISPGLRRRALHRFLWKLLSESAEPSIADLVRQINRETLRVRIRAVKLGYASSQWGSCSYNGTIMLNSALLLTTPSILRYVTIHELAHRIRTDHSPKYWGIVESVLPNYEALRGKLSGYKIASL